MNLNDALTAFAHQLELDPAVLSRYTAEDEIGGYHHNAYECRFPSGSLWAVEGKVLYALIRALRPLSIVELGVNYGASTIHLRRAVEANWIGHVVSVDCWEGAGSLIPLETSKYGELRYTYALDFIPTLPDNSVDFVFEDLCHGEREVEQVITALRPKLNTGAVVVHHDSEHGKDGMRVRRGIEAAGVAFEDYLSLLIEPSDCGIAVWRL